MSVALVQSALKILDGKWAKFETQHDRLRAEFGDRLEDHDYIREDLMGEVTYLQQRADREVFGNGERTRKVSQSEQPGRKADEIRSVSFS